MSIRYLPAAVGLAFCFVVLYLMRHQRLPPGPPKLPLIGNLHQLGKKRMHERCQEWHRQYGPLIQLQLGLDRVVVIGNSQIARDLLDKKGSLYSSRPRFTMAHDCVTRGFHTATLPYGPRWRLHNRLQLSVLNKRIVTRCRQVQEFESLQLMHELLFTNDFHPRFQRWANSLQTGLGYGQRLAKGDECNIHEMEHISRVFREIFATGIWLVDLFPVLNHLPAALAPWKSKADEHYSRTVGLFQLNTDEALRKDSWNWTKKIRSLKESQDLPRDEVNFVVGVMAEAGGDTTGVVLDMFTLAAVLHPDAMARAQQEIDSVVGPDRLPTFEDVDQLPYVTAVIKEVLRWHPAAPFGLPHSVIQDDTYEGYNIPAGTTVIASQWSINFDPETFPSPHEFRPERYLDNPDLPVSSFGFGRRACPGRYFAMDSLFISVSRILWGFRISPIKDGAPIPAWGFVMDGALMRPAPFEALFSARDVHRQRLIMKDWAAVDKDADKLYNAIEPVGAEMGFQGQEE
ncbi:cytochrome protein [Aspergillus cavernicola]|uniref:Cytochrome protein n=1 Tax=Aspergillus cavernicola TaxID=176166 RepID=A0ABR4HXG0_9EURO